MSDMQRDTLTPKAVMFETVFEVIKKLNMSLLSNVTDIENEMPIAIVTLQGVNMGTVAKKTVEAGRFRTVTYTLNGAVLYIIIYPINANGSTGKGVIQNLLPEDAVTYMGW